MITVENVTFQLKSKVLLDDVSAKFEAGKISLIVGPNGAGKSTLVKLLSQELQPSAGSILWGGQRLHQRKKAEMAQCRAVLSQSNVMAFPMQVCDVVAMGRYPHFEKSPAKIDAEICAQAMAFFEVEKLANRNFNSLSGGEKQRVHFSRVAAQIWPENKTTTKVLLLDEPLTYLDIYHQHDFMEKLLVLAKMQPMIIVGVVHDLNLALKYADEILLLNQGKVHDFGAPKKVFSVENMQAVFRLQPHFYTDDNGRSSLCF